MEKIIFILVLAGVVLFVLHLFSYKLIKNWFVKRRKWDLNICCGNTDGGGVNADIFQHKELKNFVLIKNIYNLPFKDKEFEKVLCSHTIEHVENPEKFFKELQRVGENVYLVVPPIWDLCASLNFLEHKRIFFSCKKVHKNHIPPFVKLPFAETFQEKFGQKVKA